MNKILDNLTSISKAFYGLIIYFAISFIFSYIINANINNLTYVTYNIILISSELITATLLLIIFRKKLLIDFKDFDKNYKDYLSVGFKIWIIGFLVMLLSNYYINLLVPNTSAYNQELNQLAINNYPLYSVISIVMIGPFIEELVFRFSFKNNLKSKKMYYLLSVLIFSSLHALNGFNSLYDLLYFIPYGALAFTFSYIYDKTDNIFTTVIIHTFHNFIAVLLITMTTFLGG